MQNAPASAVDTTNPNYHFIIIQPGSYYLSANLSATKTNGILINTDGITLDLSGFQVSKSGAAAGNGIEIGATGQRSSVRNGSIKGFNRGVSSGTVRGSALRDLAVSDCIQYAILVQQGAVLEFCRVHSNSGTGEAILAGPGATLINCTAYNNSSSNAAIRAREGSTLLNCSAAVSSGASGIEVENGCSLTNCSAYFNSGTYGILAGDGSTLTNCSAYDNTTTYAIYANNGSSLNNCSVSGNTVTYGIWTGGNCSLINCSASQNTARYGIWAGTGSSLTNCSAGSNTSADTFSAGIRASDQCVVTNCSAAANRSTAGTLTASTGRGFEVSGSTIQNCSAVRNHGDGIYVYNDCVIRDNLCSWNGISTGDGAGIHIFGDHNRIENNNVTNNDRGIEISVGFENLIVKNSAGDNSPNYIIGFGNKDAQVISPGTGFISTDPWANFSY